MKTLSVLFNVVHGGQDKAGFPLATFFVRSDFFRKIQ